MNIILAAMFICSAVITNAYAAEMQQCDTAGKYPCVIVGCTGPVLCKAKDDCAKCGINISCPIAAGRVIQVWEEAHPLCCGPNGGTTELCGLLAK
jgi:hypothetical protein